MNITLARRTIEALLQNGISEFCICAGARNSPFVVSLEASENLQVHRFFDERSAAFFALGRIQKEGRPVAVITTSGTAVAELLPAAVEATYLKIPLILVTADRPQRYRGSGAPQTIEQVGIFSHYVEKCFDLCHVEDLSLFSRWSEQEWTKTRPLQLNVCFEEPLLDEPVENISQKHVALPLSKQIISAKQLLPLQLKNSLVIVGALNEKNRAQVIQNLLRWQTPIYAEALSGIRGEPSLQHLLLQSGERIVSAAFQKSWSQSVLRIGGIPTLRFWRDLEDKFAQTPVVSIADSEFTGLSRSVAHYQNFDQLDKCEIKNEFSDSIFSFDQERFLKLKTLLESLPKSEPGLFYQLAKKLIGQSVYIGNSMPIREWDLCATNDLKFARLFGNRGANGIDGQISTFLGWSHLESENWAVVGDLTALYDLSALWMSEAAGAAKLRIVVINNGGGHIFKNIFHDEKFLNRHKVQFQKWAEMFHWSYQSWEKIPERMPVLFDREVIEIFPREFDTDTFWREYQKL